MIMTSLQKHQLRQCKEVQIKQNPAAIKLAAGLLFFLSACSHPIEVKTAKVTRSHIEDVITGVSAGTILAEQDTELAFGSVGRVSKLPVKLGDVVQKGQVLAELENDDLKTTVATSTRDFDRVHALKASKAISSTQLDDTERAKSIAAVALERTLIRAPFNGFIADLNLEVGQLAQITAVIPLPPIRLVDTAPRYVKVQFDEIDLVKIKEGIPARIKVLANRKAPFEGVVRRVSPFVSSVKEQDRTAAIEVNVFTDQMLPVGASADVEVILSKKDNVLVAPPKSVLGSSQDRFVFILDNNKAKKVPVTTGITNFDMVEILSGLQEGDTVIIPDDRNSIKNGDAVTIRATAA